MIGILFDSLSYIVSQDHFVFVSISGIILVFFVYLLNFIKAVK